MALWAGKEQPALNEKHRQHPMPGDFWHDTLSPCYVVVGTVAGLVLFCKTTKDTGKDHWTWDLDKIESLPRHEFAKRLTYGGLRNHPPAPDDALANQTWCDVAPEHHAWVPKVVAEMNDENGKGV